MTAPKMIEDAYLDGDLVVYGDQAYNFDEWMAYVQKRKTIRKPEKPAVWGIPATPAERLAERREYNREWMRSVRGTPPQPSASLHGLACTGPTRATGCRCKKIKLYRRPEDAR